MKRVRRRVTEPVRFCRSDAVLSTDGPVNYCTCHRGQQDGWSNLGQPPGVWVHPKCGLPSKACA